MCGRALHLRREDTTDMRARETKYDTGQSDGGGGGGCCSPAPPTPRIEAGEKVVLPSGQVRKIESVEYQVDETGRDVSVLVVKLTGRWLDRG